MTLVPEKLARFRIVVPSEHEAELLAALRAVAKVHLEEPLQEGSTLPELFVEVLEGRVTPSTLNFEEALSTARKVLREKDPLLLKLEELFTEYKKLQVLRDEKLQVLRILAEQLKALGVSPSNLRREFHGVIIDAVLTSEESVGTALGELLRVGCSVRKLKLAPGEYVLLLTYLTTMAERVENIKKKYCSPLDLPEWFYDDYDKVRKRLEEEELRIRKEALDILLSIASAIRDALEFEKISREEILEKVHRAVESVREELPRLENTLLRVISLHLAVHAHEKGTRALETLGLDKKLTPIVDGVLGEKKLDDKLVKKALGKYAKDELISEMLYSLKIYNSLLIAKQLVSEAKQITDSEKTYCIICGTDDLEQDLKALLGENTRIKMKLEKESDDFYAALLEGDQKDLEEIAKALRKRFTIVALLYRSGVESLEKQIADSLSSKKAELLANIIYINVSKNKRKGDLIKVLTRLGRQDLYKLWQSYSSLGTTAEQALLSWHFQLKEIISNAEDAVRKIREVDEETALLLGVPLHELSDALSGAVSKLKDTLQKVHHVLQHSALIESSLKVRSMLRELRIMRERRVTIVEGYIPAGEKQRMEEAIRKMVPRVLYFRAAEVPRSEPAPTYIEKRGLRKYFYSLTSLRGIPSYGEIDPTPFFTALFVAMYGMMFGDVGHGLVLALFGAWLMKTRYRLLGISERGAASLGALALLAGISSIVFGALYGFSVFLKPLAHPILSPIHDIYGMMAVAICFGIAQLMLAMLLNFVNRVIAGDLTGAIFSGMGGMGILFYSTGVVVGYHIVTSGFNLGVLSAPQLQPFVYLLLASMLAVLGHGFFEWRKAGSSEKLIHAVSEVLEMIIALPANTMSYLRLAAFAMAHEVFGILAEYMSATAGELTSYLAANILVLAIEGIAVGIQAMRLVFYEFSGKFFKGGGTEFRPAFIAVR
uniref:A-type ATP synthase subunit I n=1 Tax=Thermofilum pendens TaxID=2269 RepID=A0A7C4B949_THEPE